MKIETLPIDRLKPCAKNARPHSAEQIDALTASIKRFGFNNPALIDDAGQIIAGHGRVQAAKLAGMTDIPCIRLSHLTPAERRAYVIADNRISEMGGWDSMVMADEIASIMSESDISMMDFGIDSASFPMLFPDVSDSEAATAVSASPAPEKTDEPDDPDGDTETTGDDFQDIDHGLKEDRDTRIKYPLILQLDASTWKRWRVFVKGYPSSSAAISTLMEMIEA